MNRTKVTVACKACQKKKVKCTGISPCTNCIRTGHRCEFTGTAKKRGPRNGNVEVIKSPAKRIENVIQKNPNLRDQIEQMVAHNNTRSAVHSARLSPVIPSDAPIVIIDDDTGVTTDASQSHGIPRSTSNYLKSCTQGSFSHAAMSLGATYTRDGVSIEPNQDIIPHSPVLRKPVPMYPVNMQQSHVTNEINSAAGPNSSHLGSNVETSLPSISILKSQIDTSAHSLPLTSSQNRMTLPAPNCMARKKAMSMPMLHLSSGIEVLLPPAPDLANPFDSHFSNLTAMSVNQTIELPPLEYEAYSDVKTPPTSSTYLTLPSPPSSQSFASPKSASSGLYYTDFGKSQCSPPTPTNSPPLSPNNSRAEIFSCPRTWGENTNYFDGFSRKGNKVEFEMRNQYFTY